MKVKAGYARNEGIPFSYIAGFSNKDLPIKVPLLNVMPQKRIINIDGSLPSPVISIHRLMRSFKTIKPAFAKDEILI
jgi:hypothetical protein